MKNKGKYRFLLLLLAGFVCGSCIYDQYPVENADPDLSNGYSLNFMVTLDQLGGTRADVDPLKKWDEYIDPEKFRVLFFDSADKFLFESKSRWVKQLAPTAGGYAQWMVSVPMYAYGNDVEYDWPWERIREILMEGSFKIAILANRPNKVWYPTFTEAAAVGDGKDRWLDNTGPNWTRLNSVACPAGERGRDVKDVFDLHHCQYDLVYHAKGLEAGYYSIIMGDYDSSNIFRDKRPTMGATCSWVLLDKMDENGNVIQENKVNIKDGYDSDYPSSYKVYASALPSDENPIPMYGIQKFNRIDKWIKGTPFNLSMIASSDAEGGQQTGYDFESVALLRASVKLELLLPKVTFPKRPTFVSLWYSNIYSRCEPLNNWDSTKDIWLPHDAGCDWKSIMNHGPFCSEKFDPNNRNQDGLLQFQNTLSWYYGEWVKSGKWTLKNASGTVITPPAEDDGYPKIFNPCVQRNKVVVCGHDGDISDAYNDGYWHFVMYTGERNMNDPNNIDNVTRRAYSTAWIFKDPETNNYYSIPIADYFNGDKNKNKTAQAVFGPYKSSDFNNKNGANNTNDPTKASVMPSIAENYGNNLRTVTSVDEMPWPLLRNHVYRITVGGTPGSRSGGDNGLVVTTENLHSETLNAY